MLMKLPPIKNFTINEKDKASAIAIKEQYGTQENDNESQFADDNS